jgi:hypothetical protein
MPNTLKPLKPRPGYAEPRFTVRCDLTADEYKAARLAASKAPAGSLAEFVRQAVIEACRQAELPQA